MPNVTVQSLPDHAYALFVNDGRHSWVADERVEDGGDDLGPSPYELLLSALGACTAMTLFMYARRKEWDLAEVSVHLTHDRIHAEDCQFCTEEERVAAVAERGGRIEVIQRDISVRGQLSEEQVQRLLEIAERCPVHRTLQTPPKVHSTIVSGP